MSPLSVALPSFALLISACAAPASASDPSPERAPAAAAPAAEPIEAAVAAPDAESAADAAPSAVVPAEAAAEEGALPQDGHGDGAQDQKQGGAAQETGTTQAELEALTEEIRLQVEVLRGKKFLRPVKVSVASKEEFVRYARERMERSTTDEKLAAEECQSKLLGLVPVGMDLQDKLMRVLETQVGGFYDPDTDSFCLMSSFRGGVAKVILAHELTHALDDQHFDLDAAIEERKHDADRLFAYQAAVEGSGTAMMSSWTLQHLGEIEPGELEEVQDLGADELREAPEYIWKPLLGAYLRGAAFLARTRSVLAAQMKKLDPADIDQALREPPRSSEQILHPEKYWDPAERDEPRAVSVSAESLPQGWKVLGTDVIGEIGWGLVLTPPEKRSGLDPSNALALVGLSFGSDATAGWGGDRWLLLGREDARVLVAATAWDSTEDAAEFDAVVRTLLPHVEAAAREMAGGGEGAGESGVEVEWNQDDRVLLRVWSGLAKGEREVLDAAVKVEVAAAADVEVEAEGAPAEKKGG